MGACNGFQTTLIVTRKNWPEELCSLMCFHVHADASTMT